MAVIAGHELDYQEAFLLPVIPFSQQALVLDRDVEMKVAVLLVVADQGDTTDDSAAWVEDRQAFGVVDA